MPTANFLSWADKPNQRRILAATLSLYKISDASTVTLRAATVAGYWDGINYFEPLIPVDYTFEVAENTQIITHGASVVEYGELPLTTEHDAVIVQSGETWEELLGSEYAWANRNISLRFGGGGKKGLTIAWSDWLEHQGYMGAPSHRGDLLITVPIYPLSELVLRKRIPPGTYAEA